MRAKNQILLSHKTLSLIYKVIVLLSLVFTLGSVPSQVQAVTPPEDNTAEAKPANFRIFTPWEAGLSSSNVGCGYNDIGQCAHDGQMSYALDFNPITQGRPIYPIAPGFVVFSGLAGGYGNAMVIRHDVDDQYYYSLYAHLASAPTVLKGNPIDFGTQVGIEGSSGTTGGTVHLHFELHHCPSTVVITNTTFPATCKNVVPEPLIGQDVYEGLGWLYYKDFHSGSSNPLVSWRPADYYADTTSPTGSWLANTTVDRSNIAAGNDVVWDVGVQDNNLGEIRLTIYYDNWSAGGAAYRDFDPKKVWYIVARCDPTSPQSPCAGGRWIYHWNPLLNTGASYNTYGVKIGSGSPMSIPWQPDPFAPAQRSITPACISFDVFDTYGNSNYAAGGFQGSSCFELLAFQSETSLKSTNLDSPVSFVNATTENTFRQINILPYDPANPSGPAGYSYCASENGICALPGLANVAYGANSSYYYQYNKTGSVNCNNATFGDPIPNTAKACFYKSLILPSLTSVNPATAVVGSAGFSLSINGSNFVISSKVRWNGTELTTTFINSSSLTAAIPSQYLSTAGIANVTVNNPISGGGSSNSASFTVTQITNGCDYLDDFSFSPGSPSNAKDITIHTKIKTSFPNFRAARLKVAGIESLGEFSSFENSRVWHTANTPDGDRSIILEIDDNQGSSWDAPLTCSRPYHLDTRPAIPPGDFGLIAPANGASIPQSYLIDFQWQASQGTQDYRVHLWNGSGIDFFTAYQIDTHWIYVAQTVGTYYWQIEAHGSNSQIKNSPVWSFTITPQASVPTFRLRPLAGNNYSVGQHIYFNIEVDTAGRNAWLNMTDAQVYFDNTRLRLSNVTNVANSESVGVFYGKVGISYPRNWAYCGNSGGVLAVLDFEVIAGGKTELYFDWDGPNSFADFNNIYSCWDQDLGQSDLLENIINTSVDLVGPGPVLPAPTINSLTVNNIVAQSANYRWVGINGTNFYTTSVVKVNGVDTETHYSSNTSVTGRLDNSILSVPGNYNITVYTPGGGISNSINFTVLPPADTISPSINWTSPVSNEGVFSVGNETVQLEVSVADNVGISKVRFYRWNAVTLQYVEIGNLYSSPYRFNLNTTSLNTRGNEIFAQAFDAAGNVSNPKSIWLYRQLPNPIPSISSLSNNSIIAGSSDTAISISGSGFLNASVVRWNGMDISTTFVDNSHLNAIIPASELNKAGSKNITVFSPGPGGGTSIAKIFTITPNGICVPNYPLSLGSLDTWSNAGVGSTQQSNYYSGVGWNESGPEYTYVFNPPESVLAYAKLNNMSANLDIFVIEDKGDGCKSNNAIAYGDTDVTFSAIAGHTYYLVVDGNNESVSNYTISFDQTSQNSTPTATVIKTSTLTNTPTGASTLTLSRTPSPSAIPSTRTSTPTATPITAQFQVNMGSDDGGVSDLCVSQTNLNEVYLGKCANGSSITSGFRFANVTIPPEAQIINASIQFRVDGIYNNDISVTFYGEASGNSQTFSTASMPVNRTLTSASTNWPIPASDVWYPGQARTSPDVKNIVQEIVNRLDWSSGNTLAIIAKDSTASGAPSNHRRVFAYERAGVIYTAQLIVTYRDPISPRATLTPTRTPTLTMQAFISVAAQDGWILESGETSNIGSIMKSSMTVFNLGDDVAKRQYRGILSFSTGTDLPDNAVITGVTLKVKKSTVVGGGNPVATFQGFMVDIKNGTFGTAALQTSDFQAKASKSYGPFKTVLVEGWYSINLTSAQAYINKLSSASGMTQIRLRFQLDDNNNAVANYLNLFSGNAPAANRPQLIIEYYVP